MILSRPVACMMRRSICIAFLLAAYSVFGQQPDSTILQLSTEREAGFKIRNTTQSVDTVLDNLQNYYQVGVLGNIGLPSYSLLADATTEKDFFRWMNLNNANDLFTSQQPVYFYPQGKVYTKVFGAMGQKQEQVFKLLHSQNIKRVNVSLQFNRYSALGFYIYQKSITDNVLFSSHATTKNGRWGYNFYTVYNKLKYQINGGLDTARMQAQGLDFEKNLLVDKQLFPVLMSTTRQNVKTSEYNLETFFRLNKDSAWAGQYISWTTNYQSNYWLYVDASGDSSKYLNTYYYYAATDGSHDSLSLKRFSNSLTYKLQSEKFSLYAGYKNEFSHYNQVYTDTMVMNHIALAGVKIALKNHLLTAHAQYAVAGFNAGNYLINASYRLLAGKNFYLKASANANKQMVPYMSRQFFGAHFIWNDTFSDILTENAKLEFGSAKYRFTIGGFAQSQTNQVYFDTLALPKQYRGSTMIARVFAQKDLRLAHIHFNNLINYQTTPNTDIIRLPQLYTFHQLYYEGKLFKKALWLQAGVQARYISSFMANAYMPATNQFYLQNQKEYGNYVFVDVFINAQIERFRFFLMASHINQGLSGGNYFLCPNYAMPDRSLKAGLCWMFFD